MSPTAKSQPGVPVSGSRADHGAFADGGHDTSAFSAEQPFRRVVEYAPNAMVMIDRDGYITLVNLQTERMFGYERSALIGQPIEMLVPERFRTHHGEFRTGFFASPQPRPMGLGRDLYGRHADGNEFPVEIGLNPIDTQAGVMVLASIVDITERRRAQETLEDALREKTVLLNEVHHRVKNNLQMVSSLLNLQAAAGDPRLRDVLNETQSRVRAMSLTHQLLYERKDFSRIDLGEYLDRLSQLMISAYRISAKRISLRPLVPLQPVFLDLPRAIPCGLVVNELVTNAFKHAFPGERQGEIVIGLTMDIDGYIEVTVADDGIGLPVGFDIDEVKSLGLQLVPLLADQLHARLEVTGGPGARFSLRFAGPVAMRRPS